MIDLDKYKPGQLITSMSRLAFLDLWQDVRSGEAIKRWPEDKIAQTRKERTEEIRIRAMIIIYEDFPNIFNDLLQADDWSKMEIYMGEDALIHFRVLRDRLLRKG